jgi:hypothetical protein
MYGCLSGTILLNPASTTRREADTAKSAVRRAKATSHALRWSKTRVETRRMTFCRFMSAS